MAAERGGELDEKGRALITPQAGLHSPWGDGGIPVWVALAHPEPRGPGSRPTASPAPRGREREKHGREETEAGRHKKPGPEGGARASADAPSPPGAVGAGPAPSPTPGHTSCRPHSARKTREQRAPRACCPHSPVSPSSG